MDDLPTLRAKLLFFGLEATLETGSKYKNKWAVFPVNDDDYGGWEPEYLPLHRLAMLDVCGYDTEREAIEGWLRKWGEHNAKR